jgi:hypothetical protein
VCFNTAAWMYSNVCRIEQRRDKICTLHANMALSTKMSGYARVLLDLLSR